MRTLFTLGFAFVIAIVLTMPLVGQQAPNQPIEFPEFIVTGKERVDVPGGTKNMPARPPVLRKAQLDTLNAVEKAAPPVIPPAILPMPTRPIVAHPGYVSAELGQYTTPDVQAGYSMVVGGYRLDAAAGIEASNGHLTNAAYHKAHASVLSTFIAPEQYLVFGGSTTETDIGIASRAYRFFGDSAAAERTVFALRAAVDVEGEYQGFTYRATAGYRRIGITTDVRESADAVIHGHIDVEQRWRAYDVGGSVSVNLRSFGGVGYPFIEGKGRARYIGESVRLLLDAGLQAATSTGDVSRAGFLIAGRADVNLGPDLTAIGTLRSGLRAVVFSDLLTVNPYVSDSLLLDAAYDVVDLGGTVLWHPTTRLGGSIGVRVRITDRDAVWTPSAAGAFGVSYFSTTTIEIPIELRWLVSSTDVVRTNVSIVSSSIADAAVTPYVPSAQAAAWYDRSWTQDLRTALGLIYVGQRYADIDNKRALSGYVDVRLRAEFDIAERFTLTARVNNLLGADILLWDGYRERGIFVSAGCTWRL